MEPKPPVCYNVAAVLIDTLNFVFLGVGLVIEIVSVYLCAQSWPQEVIK